MSDPDTRGKPGKAAPKQRRSPRGQDSRGAGNVAKPDKSPAERKPAQEKKPRRAQSATAKPARPGPAANRSKRKADSGKTVPETMRNDAPASPPAQRPIALIRVEMPVRWRDLDAFNHVNNSQFLSYLEETRLQWMMSLPGDWIDENVAPVVVAAHLNYRRPIAWPGGIAVELFVERLGNTSLSIGHRIVDAGDAGVLYADGNVVMVWIDKHRGETAALPESVRRACTAG